MKLYAAVVLAVVLGVSAIAWGQGPTTGGKAMSAAWHKVETRGMTMRWRLQGTDKLAIELEAPSEGWVAVGFHTARQLKGTRFVIAAHRGSTTKAEEHLAVVPTHDKVEAHGKTSRLIKATTTQSGGRTTARLLLRLDSGDGDALVAGRRYHVMLAYSRSDDFDHHSAMRTSIDLTL